MIECALLGPVRIIVDGGAAPRALHWKKHLALLVYLACAPRRLQNRSFLADLLWGGRDEPRARHSLNEAARVLRRTLGEDAVLGGADDLGLQRGAVVLDLERFAECAARGAWMDAAELIRGEFLEGFGIPDAAAFEDWVASERLAWRRRSLDALVRASALERDRGNLPGALALATRAVSLEPLSDRAVQARMRAEALDGDREEALATFAEFARRMRTEVNAEPAPETVDLARCIRLAPRHSGAAATPKPDMLPLMDREAELVALSQIWQAVRAGNGVGAVIIRGPSGVGRSRLLTELTSRAALDGAFVASARAVAGDHATAGGTLLALVSTMLQAPGVPGADPAALATMAAAEPAWANRFGTGQARLPLAAAARAIIAAIAEETPLVLAVDDAHCADVVSIETFELLLRDLAGGRVLLALTTLDHPARQEIEQLAARTGRDAPGCVVTLGALTLASAERLAGFMLPRLGADDRARLARRVMHDTAGSPLLVTALLRAVRSGLDLDAASWPAPSRTLTATLPAPLPDELAAAIRLVFRELGEDAQRVGAAAAALGERLVVEELTLAAGLDAPAVERAIDELERRGWVLWDARGYSFGAQLTRDVIARDLLTPGQRRRIRDRAGWTGPPPRLTP